MWYHEWCENFVNPNVWTSGLIGRPNGKVSFSVRIAKSLRMNVCQNQIKKEPRSTNVMQIIHQLTIQQPKQNHGALVFPKKESKRTSIYWRGASRKDEEKKSAHSLHSKKAEKPKRGIAVYLENIFKEKDKIVRDAEKVTSKYKYLLEEKKQLSNQIRYLELQLAESNKKSTLVERKSNDNLSDNVNQAITNIVTTHYRRYGENVLVKKLLMLFGRTTL